jgi:hypothetical protein
MSNSNLIGQYGGMGAVPVGAILPWVSGYFTASTNTGHTPILASADTIAAANSYLNTLGYYVCDGSALNIPDSPVWNAAGRYLPNLTDSRFLMGSTTIGVAANGGSNTMADHKHANTNLSVVAETAHTHGVGTFKNTAEDAHTHASDLPAHRHFIKSRGTSTDGSHRHLQNQAASASGGALVVGIAATGSGAGANGYTEYDGSHAHSWGGSWSNDSSSTIASPEGDGSGNTYQDGVGYWGVNATRTTSVGSSHTHVFSGTSEAGSTHTHTLSGVIGSGSVDPVSGTIENRPQYMKCFMIIKVL